MICSIFIYFGVACIGLLLGSYIAGILDERASQDRESKLINSCPSCARIRTLKDNAARRAQRQGDLDVPFIPEAPMQMHRFPTERNCSSGTPPKNDMFTETYAANEAGRHSHHHHRRPNHRRHMSETIGSAGRSSSFEMEEPVDNRGPPPPPDYPAPGSFSPGISANNAFGSPQLSVQTQQMSGAYTKPPSNVLGSPVTRQILSRQRHTRHQSIDIRGSSFTKTFKGPARKFSHDLGLQTPTIDEAPSLNTHFPSSSSMRREKSKDSLTSMYYDSSDSDDDSTGSTSSSESSTGELLDEHKMRIKTAKYVFVTLRQALVNSMVIIAVGSVGFYFIEDWSMVNSWYYTTVFLTT
jgi:hypothetical protein